MCEFNPANGVVQPELGQADLVPHVHSQDTGLLHFIPILIKLPCVVFGNTDGLFKSFFLVGVMLDHNGPGLVIGIVQVLVQDHRNVAGLKHAPPKNTHFFPQVAQILLPQAVKLGHGPAHTAQIFCITFKSVLLRKKWVGALHIGDFLFYQVFTL